MYDQAFQCPAAVQPSDSIPTSRLAGITTVERRFQIHHEPE